MDSHCLVNHLQKINPDLKFFNIWKIRTLVLEILYELF
jgi:hypothetical protein